MRSRGLRQLVTTSLLQVVNRLVASCQQTRGKLIIPAGLIVATCFNKLSQVCKWLVGAAVYVKFGEIRICLRQSLEIYSCPIWFIFHKEEIDYCFMGLTTRGQLFKAGLALNLG